MSDTMQLWITRLFLVLPLTSIRNAFAFVPPPLATSSTTIGQRNDQALLLMVDGSTTLSTLNHFYETQPYLSAFVTCSVKASAADLIAQTRQGLLWSDTASNYGGTSNPVRSLTTMTTTTTSQGETGKAMVVNRNINVVRNLGFLLYGGLYQGMVQYYLYNVLFPKIFGLNVTFASVVGQVTVDMLLLTPFLCLPVAYIVKASINSDETIMEALENYVLHVQTQGLLTKYWTIWIPVQCLTFGVIPIHLRIPFIALISFFWLMILSTISAKRK